MNSSGDVVENKILMLFMAMESWVDELLDVYPNICTKERILDEFEKLNPAYKGSPIFESILQRIVYLKFFGRLPPPSNTPPS